MTELYTKVTALEHHLAEADRLRKEIDEEQKQRASFAQVMDALRTRGGTRAFLIIPEEVASARDARRTYGYSDVAEGRGFHWRGGLYFQRERDGAVVISDWRRVILDDGTPKWAGTDIARIDADSWASIVASVSLSGESDGRYDRARVFNNE
jgi:hypothetical protein